LQIEAGLKSALSDLAWRNRRSLTAEIVVALTHHIEQNPSDAETSPGVVQTSTTEAEHEKNTPPDIGNPKN